MLLATLPAWLWFRKMDHAEYPWPITSLSFHMPKSDITYPSWSLFSAVMQLNIGFANLCWKDGKTIRRGQANTFFLASWVWDVCTPIKKVQKTFIMRQKTHRTPKCYTTPILYKNPRILRCCGQVSLSMVRKQQMCKNSAGLHRCWETYSIQSGHDSAQCTVCLWLGLLWLCWLQTFLGISSSVNYRLISHTSGFRNIGGLFIP